MRTDQPRISTKRLDVEKTTDGYWHWSFFPDGKNCFFYMVSLLNNGTLSIAPATLPNAVTASDFSSAIDFMAAHSFDGMALGELNRHAVGDQSTRWAMTLNSIHETDKFLAFDFSDTGAAILAEGKNADVPPDQVDVRRFVAQVVQMLRYHGEG